MKKNILIALLLSVCVALNLEAQRNMEFLDRGLVAVKVTNGVFLSWRVLGTDAKTTSFNLYRGTTKVNASPITGATNLVDADGTLTSTYTVRPIVNGVELAADEIVPVQPNFYRSFPVTPPSVNSLPDGSTYTYNIADGSTGDLDGDGKLDIVMIWNPSNQKDNSLSGYTGNVWMDGYTMAGKRLFRIDLGKNIRSGCHYSQFVVADFDADGKAEIMVKTAPGTKDGSGAFLSKGVAAGADHTKDYRNSKGYILSGPEWLTVFSGTDGKELATVDYNPGRGTVSSWGDSYGNRVDRFLAAAAWLDGVKPSGVFQRGYYTRMAIAAWDWDGTTLKQKWYYNAATKGAEGYGQGNHNLSVGDVDGDGKDEIIEGACAIDHDGKFMYRTGLGHGDAMHLSDLDPDIAGMEVYCVHEETSAAYGYEMHSAATGKVLWGVKTGTDNGRGLAADVDLTQRGHESWSFASSKIQDVKGKDLTHSRGMINFRCYWDGDLADETLEYEKVQKLVNGKWTQIVTLSDYGVHANDGNKYTPCLLADLYGDWREEIVMGATDMKSIKIFTTTDLTTYRQYTLMHDPTYRAAISWQNTAYNQPPHLGFWLGAGTDKAPTPNIKLIASNGNKAPSVGITAPGNGTTYLPPATFTITATATDADGTVSRVDFYNGTKLLGSSSTSPYSFTLSNAVAGTYTLTAVATDNKGASTTSAAVKVIVSAVPIAYVYESDVTDFWTTAAKWIPAAVPTVADTAIIRSGECKIQQDHSGLIQVETDGVFRAIGYFNFGKIELLGGTIKVNTSNQTYGMNATFDVKLPSIVMSGNNPITLFTLAGTITGSGMLTKNGIGLLKSNATGANFKGQWYVAQDTLTITTASGLGQCGALVDTAVLDIDVAASTNMLKIKKGGKLNLDANLTVQLAVFDTINLAAGTYTKATLPVFISGNGSLIVAKSVVVQEIINKQPSLTAKGGTAYLWSDTLETKATTATFAPTASVEYSVETTIFDGCLMESAPVKVTVITEQSIALQKGWNLISINVRPTDSTIATLFNGLDVIEIKDMKTYWRKDQPSFLNLLQTIMPGEGYLVNMNAEGTLTVMGTPIVETHGRASLPTNGWQLIGCPYPTAALIVGILGSTFLEVKNFEGFNIPGNANNTILNIEPGKGYFVK